MSDLKVPVQAWNPYGLARELVQAVFRVANRLEVTGQEFIPADGPFLLASNHASFIDPPLLSAAVPPHRQLYFFARKTLFKGAFGKLIASLQAIPVDRDGDSDLGAFRRVFAIMQQGGCLLVFPEGTRSRDGQLQPAQKGVGLIACRSAVPVVPARVFGTYEYWGRGQKLPRLGAPLRVGFGPAIAPEQFDPGKRDPDRYLHAAEAIMARIARIS